MPVISGPTPITTTLVQDIINGTAQDIRQVLSAQDSSQAPILLDYTTRVCLQILRASGWAFMVSNTQSFLTQTGINDYWIGYQQGNPLGTFDTGLGINDLRNIKEDEVYDRTNFTKLFKIQAPPLAAVLEFPDGSARPGRPKMWQYDPVDNPYVLSIYPAPDNQSTYQPVPEPPIVFPLTNAGTLPNRFYFLKATFVDSFGNESSPSNETRVFIPSGMLLQVQPPQPPPHSYAGGSSTSVRYDQYRLYATAGASGTETFQVQLSTNSPWTEPITGITSNGNPPPSSNNVEPIDGYLLQFKYYKNRIRYTDYNQIIQVPDDYKDVVIAGVNWLANEYLRRYTDAKAWQEVYMNGVVAIRRDQNMYPHRDFIRTDPATTNTNFPAVEVTDPSITRTN